MTERYIPMGRDETGQPRFFTRDWMTFGDIIGYRNGHWYVVQACALGDISTRVKKILAAPEARELLGDSTHNHIRVYGFDLDSEPVVFRMQEVTLADL